MTDKIPQYVKPLSCTKVTSGAVTYHLRPVADVPLGGWALATVNDATGELAIQSDWGNWSFRWNTDHIGCESLTHFIAGRFTGDGDCDYLANKLTSREDRERFDSHATVEYMQRDLAQKRLAWGRDYLAYYDGEHCDVMDSDPPRVHRTFRVWDRYLHKHEDWPLTKMTARTLFDAIGELGGEDNVDRFQEAYFKIEGHDIITSEPWHGELQFTPTHGYMQLLHAILPALVKACFERLYPGRHRCEKRMMREDGAGHWRDFHRGHGCHLDPGAAR